MTTLKELAAAMAVVANARPEDVQKLEMAKAVEGVNFMDEVRRGVPQPGMGAVNPRNRAVAEAAEASHAAMIARDRVDHARQAAIDAAAVEYLASGQTPENSAAIRRQGRVP